MNLWFMRESAIGSLQEEIASRRALIGSSGFDVGSSKPIASEVNGINILRIHGPIFSRQDYFTEMMGLYSTEQYMEEFDSLLSEDKPILLDIDSPGGEASLLFEFADMIHDAGPNVHSYTGGEAASAGFLLHQAARGQSLSHEVAALGSIGAVIVSYESQDGLIEIVSKNAQHKRDDEGKQKLVDDIEEKFISYLGKFNGMNSEDVVARSEQGAIFLGSAALDKGFVDQNTNFKQALSTLTAETEGESNMKKYTEEEMQAAVDAAVEAANKEAAKMQGSSEAEVQTRIEEAELAIHERYDSLLSHNNGSNLNAVKRLAASSMSVDEALSFMDDVSASTDKSAPKTAKVDYRKIAADAAMRAIETVRASSSDTSELENNGGVSDLLEDDSKLTESARSEAANARRAAKKGAV